MLVLIFVTILTSAADSLNPIAITQQFVLQGLVKKPNHIWFFILATGVTNFIGGLMSYYGLLSVLSSFHRFLSDKYRQGIFITLLIVGITTIFLAIYFINIKRKSSNQQIEEKDKQAIRIKIKSVSPFSLAVLGAIATITELATALPYFAFLAVLLNYELTVIQLILILFIYNFIYSLPLMILYFIYKMKQDAFERFYLNIKKQISKYSTLIVPLVLFLVGVTIIYYAISFI